MGRMPGDEWRRFANLRLLYGYMFAHPGTKLLFMGGEFGQTSEWNHDRSLGWHLLQYAPHEGIAETLKALNSLYKSEPALHQFGFEERGFQWIDYSDRDNSVIVFKRLTDRNEDMLIVVCNFTPESRDMYRIGLPVRGQWKEIFNSDEKKFGGSGILNQGMLQTTPVKYQWQDYSITITLPPLGVSILKLHKEDGEFELGS
jgi:1,4-alpha-glucan branching enzyme